MSRISSDKQRSAPILQSSGFVFFARIGGAGLGLLIQILLARSIGSDQLGLVYLALAVANIGSVLAALGYPSVAVRFIRRYHVQKQRRPAGRLSAAFQSHARSEVLVISLALTLLVAIAVLLAPLGDGRQAPLLLGAVMIPLFAFLALNGGIANAYHRIDISYLPEVFLRPLLWLLFLLAALAIGSALAAAGAVLLACLATATAFAVQWLWLNSITVSSTANQQHDHQPAPARLKTLWRVAALPMIAMTLLTGMIFDIDIMLLSFLMTVEDIALFGVAFKIAFLIAFGVHVTQQAALPDIADAHSLKKPEKMRREIARATMASALASLAAIIALLIVGRWVLSLFGSEFPAAFSALIILSLCALIRALAGPASQILVLAGQQKKMLYVYAAGLIVLLLLNLVCVPLWGIAGAATALVGATLFWSAALSYCAYRATGVRADGLTLAAWNIKTLQQLQLFKSRSGP